MLSPPDADLVRRDPTLPGLATLLDPDAFVAALQSSLPEVRPGGARLDYVRYKHGVSCVTSYQVESGGTGVQVIAKAYRRADQIHSLRDRDRPSEEGAPSPGRVFLDDRCIAISIFPHDAKLEALARLGDAEARGRMLRDLFPARPELWGAAVHGLRYKPERRYVAQLRVGEEAAAVLKFHDELGYNAARQNAKAFESRGVLRLAERIGRSDRDRILAFGWLPGRPLKEALYDPQLEPESLGAVGAALAELHAQRPDGLTTLSRGGEATILLASAAGLGFVCPHLAARARRLAGELADHLASEDPVGQPIHGDFTPGQVLLGGDDVAILDLDEAVCGDPVADLALFIAHLERDALSGRIPPARVEILRDAFLEGYAVATRRPIPARLELYVTISLFRRPLHPFRHHEPDWPARVEALFDRVETLWGRSARASAPRVGHAGHSPWGEDESSDVAVTDAYRIAEDPAMPYLSRVLDPREVRYQFERCLPRLTGIGGRVELRAIRVKRHKAGRRCLIEYDVEVRRTDGTSEAVTLVGKSRAKGLDRPCHDLLLTLWDGGFAAESEDGISVPEPIGMVPDFKMWLQRKVPGSVATPLLAGPGGDVLAGRIAEAIRKLHLANIPTIRRHTMADELRILHERLAILAGREPRWARRLERLLDACDRLGSVVPGPVLRGIHRDFYPDHVIVAGSRLYLIDFDLACEGDPGLDIGNFLGHLTEQSLRASGDPDALADREEALEERYVELHGEAIRPSVRAYAALTLVRHISLSTQFADRRHITEALLELCEDRLDAAGRPKRAAVVPR